MYITNELYRDKSSLWSFVFINVCFISLNDSFVWSNNLFCSSSAQDDMSWTRTGWNSFKEFFVSFYLYNLRSSSQILLQVLVSRLKSYGDCAFSVAAPTLWNKLLANIRNASSLGNFKSLLKHIYLRSFSQINNYYLLNHYRFFTDILFGVLLYYILFVQRLWMAPASKGALLNIHYYYYY